MHAKAHAEASMKCGNPSCEKFDTSKCSGCKTQGYCGSECQKKDWKFHEGMCPFKKEGAMFLPFPKVCDVISQLKKKASAVTGKDSEIRILKNCLSFAEYQYGDRIIGQNNVREVVME
jgi:hypothetical protein